MTKDLKKLTEFIHIKSFPQQVKSKFEITGINWSYCLNKVNKLTPVQGANGLCESQYAKCD